MRKLSRALGYCAFLTLCFSACHDYSASEEALIPQTLISKARSHFERDVNTANASINSKNPRAQLRRKVAWNDAYLYDLFDGITAVAVPIQYADSVRLRSNITNRRISLNEFSRLLVYQDKSGNWHDEVVTLMPLPGSSGKKRTPFAGLALVEDWYGNPLKQFQYPGDGSQLSLAREAEVKAVDNGRTQLFALTVCTTVSGWNYSADDPKGHYWSTTTCETYYFSSGGGSADPGGGNYGGSGGGGGGGGSTGPGTPPSDPDPCPPFIVSREQLTQPPAGGNPPGPTPAPCNPIVLPPLEIMNDVDDPCVNGVVNEFKNTNAWIRFMFERNHFGTAIDLQYIEGALGVDVMANTGLGGGSGPYGSYKKVITQLNPSFVVGSSREFILAVLIHEMVHADQLLFNPTSTEAQDHEYMTQPDVFRDMKYALMDLCPNLPPNQAEALIWGTLTKTTAYANLSAAKKTEIENWSRDYRRGTMGKKCP